MARAVSRNSHSRLIAAALAAAGACALALPASSGAQTAAGSQTAAGAGAYGGTQFYERPLITSLQCRTGCTRSASVSQTGWVSVKEKGLLRIRGRNLRAVGEVLFLGVAGKSDNVGVEPVSAGSSTLDVKVPAQANNGKIVLLDPAGKSSQPSSARVRVMRDPNALSATGFTWPLPSRGYLTGHYGENRGDHMHSGVDLAVSSGTPIRAAADGTVILVGPQGAYGNFTCLRHVRLVTCYAHQSEILVRYGQFVRQKQTIGRVGSTGRSSGPHLHFEVRQGPEAWTTPLDPFKYLPKRF